MLLKLLYKKIWIWICNMSISMTIVYLIYLSSCRYCENPCQMKEFSVKSNPGVLWEKRPHTTYLIFFVLTQLSSRLKGVLSSRDSVPSKKLAIFCSNTYYCYYINLCYICIFQVILLLIIMVNVLTIWKSRNIRT